MVYIAMEAVLGGTLKEAMRAILDDHSSSTIGSPPDTLNNRLESWSAEVIRQLLDAVRYAHSKAVVHKDLKPQNVLLNASSTVTRPSIVVCDFGLAELTDQQDVASLRFRKCEGTPFYMAPEVWR